MTISALDMVSQITSNVTLALGSMLVIYGVYVSSRSGVKVFGRFVNKATRW